MSARAKALFVRLRMAEEAENEEGRGKLPR